MPEPSSDHSNLEPPLPGRIVIWTISLDRTPQFDRGIISEEEEARATRLFNLKARRRAQQLRAFARTVVGRYSGVHPSEIRFLYNENRKPFLHPNQSPVQCSWASAEGFAAIAISRIPVGIDVEHIRELQNPESVAGYALSLDELRTWRVLPDELRSSALLHSWVRKESVAKCEGRGLDLGLEKVDVQRDNRGTAGYVSLGDRLGFHWSDWDAPEGFLASVASSQPIEQLDVKEWSTSLTATGADLEPELAVPAGG